MRIAVDAMGGDYAPAEIINGVLTAVEMVEELEILLVGRAEQIKSVNGGKINSPRVDIIHADEIIGNDEDPGLTIRRKRKSSMVAALQLVRQGRADAVVSCGSTGALMAGGLLFLGRISGIRRPALLTVMPALRGEMTVMLDVGANMDARPEQMLQYALMGSIYAREILGKATPRVALLNVGVEENKGNHQVRNAYRLFQRKLPGFVGNLEAREIFRNMADVVICDGFAGNVMLKAMEGITREIFFYLRTQIEGNLQEGVVSPLLSPLMQKLRADLDEAEYGGALLIGVNGVCIKCHGASRRKAVTQALIRQAYPLVQREINKKIELELAGEWHNEEAGDE
ncbi:MAG: phosphate acyltransferase PlsX [Bacillota bacterium]